MLTEAQKSAQERYRAKHLEEIRQRDKVRYWKNREKMLAAKKDWVRENPEKVRAYEQSEKRKQYRRDYYSKNKDRIIARAKEYHRQHPEVVRKADVNFRVRTRQRLIVLLGGKCTNCGYDLTNALEVDHKNNDGKKDRQRFKNSKEMRQYYLKNPAEAKSNLQLLCAMCHAIKHATKPI